MKKISLLFSFILLTTTWGVAQDINTPAAGKSLVIFTRPVIDAPLVKFAYFDNEHFLGKIGPGSYVAYECDPGEHLFWAKAENRDFLEADLEADQIYLIETKVTTGMVKARIQLVPYGPNVKSAEKLKERLLARIAKRDEVRVDAGSVQAEAEADLEGIIEKGMAAYQKLKKKGKEVDVLTPDMHI